MIVDRTSLYGSRNIFDQHRDMRMDIDNMSYEVILTGSDYFLVLKLDSCTEYFFTVLNNLIGLIRTCLLLERGLAM